MSPFLLSGGLDSRALLAEMRAHGADTTTFTFGTPGCADVEVARCLASLLDVPHHWIPLTHDNWWHGREQVIWQTDGLVNAIHLPVAVALPYLRSGNRYTQKNTGGDNLFGGGQLRHTGAEWAREPRELVASHLRETPFFRKEEAVEAALPDCRPYLEGPSSDCFTFTQRQRRMIMTGPLAMSAHCEVATPSMDLALLQLVLGGLSDEQRRGGRFYRRALLRHYPTLYRDIPRNSTGRGLEERWRHRIPRGLRAGLSGRLRGLPLAWRIAGRVDVPHGKYHDYPGFLRGSDIVGSVARDELMIDQFLDGRARPYLEKMTDYERGADRIVLALLTIETYLRQVTGVPAATANTDCPGS